MPFLYLLVFIRVHNLQHFLYLLQSESPTQAIEMAQEYFTLPTSKRPRNCIYLANLSILERDLAARNLESAMSTVRIVSEKSDTGLAHIMLRRASDELHTRLASVCKAMESYLGRVKGSVLTLRKIATPGILDDETVVDRVRLLWTENVCVTDNLFKSLFHFVI
jgi:sulfur transfer complex TusBCD TusB component (DsrH family)